MVKKGDPTIDEKSTIGERGYLGDASSIPLLSIILSAEHFGAKINNALRSSRELSRYTYSDFLQNPKSIITELLKIPNLGRISIEEIVKYLEEIPTARLTSLEAELALLDGQIGLLPMVLVSEESDYSKKRLLRSYWAEAETPSLDTPNLPSAVPIRLVREFEQLLVKKADIDMTKVAEMCVGRIAKYLQSLQGVTIGAFLAGPPKMAERTSLRVLELAYVSTFRFLRNESPGRELQTILLDANLSARITNVVKRDNELFRSTDMTTFEDFPILFARYLTQTSDLGATSKALILKFLKSLQQGNNLATQFESDAISELYQRFPIVFDQAHNDLKEWDYATQVRLNNLAESILAHENHLDIVVRRFYNESLKSVGSEYSLTTNGIRQIAIKYDELVTRIEDDEWVRTQLTKLVNENAGELPTNDQMAAFHSLLPKLVKKLILNESGLRLTQSNRVALAEIFKLDVDKELDELDGWTDRKVHRELKRLAKKLGRPHLMPKQVEMPVALKGAVARMGGQMLVSQKVGLEYQGQAVNPEDGSRLYWTDDRIMDFLIDVAEKEGYPNVMPSQKACRKYAEKASSIVANLTGAQIRSKNTLSWPELADKFGFAYNKRSVHRPNIHFVRAFIKSLGDSIFSFDASEIYVLFENQGINRSGRTNKRVFDKLVDTIKSGFLPKKELIKWAEGGSSVLIENLLDQSLDVEEAFKLAKKPYNKLKKQSISKNEEPNAYQEAIDPHLPSPEVRDSLHSLETATEILIETGSDKEAIDFLIAKAKDKLWKKCFLDPEEAATQATAHEGNIYSESARDAFLDEYTRSVQLPIPSGYAFTDFTGVPREPKLMQKLIAYRVLKDHRVLNLSGTGTGKTLSAILASRVCGAKLTVISCPNTTIAAWQATITKSFSNSCVNIKTWTPSWPDDDVPKYLILNHEMFQNTNESLIKNFNDKYQTDLIVIDEIHQVKQRDESESQRRRLINGLITDIPVGRVSPRVLGMSATPVINNLREGRSLIELVTSTEYPEIDDEITVQNCMKVFQKFTTIGFRMLPSSKTHRIATIHPVDCSDYIKELLELGFRPHPQQVDAILLKAKWEVIRKSLKPKTVIFTEYVKDIVPFLNRSIRQEGFSVAAFTGEEKTSISSGYSDSLQEFIHGELDVLIASIHTVATGVDGLQHVSNNIIFATLPWTNTDYEQAIGRFDREGFAFDQLHIHVPRTSAILSDGQEWSWCQSKIDRLENKRDIASAAVDGEIPDNNKVLTPQKATQYWLGWLRRIERDGLSEIHRMEIKVPLDGSPSEVKRRIASYGSFGKLNNVWNRRRSSTTHASIQDNPEEWAHYHTLYQEARNDWAFVPFDDMIRWLKERNRLSVGDFGCGEAKIAQAVRDIHTVHSFDHFALHDYVTECDITDVPLVDRSLDVAIFCLSLMGRNFTDYLVEAHRTLKVDGHLHIYESTSRFKNRDNFVNQLRKIGFEVFPPEDKWKFTYIHGLRSIRETTDEKVNLQF